jgi:hypothetical protein
MPDILEPQEPYSDSHGGVLFLANRADLNGLNYFVVNPDVSEEDLVCAVSTILAKRFINAPTMQNVAAKYRVIREYCDHKAMVKDHLSGVLSYNLDYPDGFIDHNSGSGVENTNLVDMHCVSLQDERHPYWAAAQAIIDEVNAIVGERECGVSSVERIWPEKPAGLLAEVTYRDSRRFLLRVVFNADRKCLADFDVLKELEGVHA